jgi:hypothetical protein
VLGSALFLSLTDDRDVNLLLNVGCFLAAVAWRRLAHPPGSAAAWAEGLSLHLAAVAVANLLVLAFGNPPLRVP